MSRIRLLIAAAEDDLRSGLDASFPAHAVGILVALAVSTPLIVALFVLTPLGIGASTAVGAVVQIALGWVAAGRYEGRHRSLPRQMDW